MAKRRQIWVQDSGFHTEKRLGDNQAMTPEGYLLCENVPIARTGLMLYGAGEIHVNGEFLDAGDDGIIRVTRHEDDVFHPRALASFEGKSVTDDHPPEGVDPTNFRDYEIGTTHNVRRGEGVYSDCIVADLLIKDAGAIRAVQSGKREVSCGYDADYEQDAPGHAKQFNFIGNHVALVDRGRCGARCSIGDKAMAVRSKKTFLDRFRALLNGTTSDSMTKDQIAKLVQDAEKEDEEDEKDKDKDKTTDARFKKIETTLDGLPATIAKIVRDAMKDDGDDEDDDETTTDSEDHPKDCDCADCKEKRGKTGDRAMQTMDADTMRGVMQTVRSHAEVLAPGHALNMPTTDSKPTRAKFSDSMCNCKRKILDVAYRTEDGRAAIEPFLNGRTADFARMNAKTVDTIFVGAAVMRAARNNDAAGKGLRAGVTRDDFGAAPLTIDSLEKAHRDFWAPKTASK